MKRNFISSIVKIIIILILGWVSLENIAFDLVSVITDISVTQQEELLCQEYEQMDFSQYATLVGFGVSRRLLSRSLGARYEYKIDQGNVETYCVDELKKNNWDFYKIRKQGDDRKTIIFQKEKFYCLLNFDRKNQFTVNLYYKDMDRRIRGI